jgi:uncharacterized membrane protein YfcA
MTATMLIFYVLLLMVAFLYASVGHGGASGYLALMALFGVSAVIMKPSALILNLFVSLTSFIQFYRGQHFKWKIFLPIALASVPMAFIGGLLTVDGFIYKKLLGVLLLFAVARFFFFPNVADADLKKSNVIISVICGMVIGFLSGLIGIGGGIILSPVLLMLRWTNQKQTAAISALFILVNSISGLAGQLIKGISVSSDMITFTAIAFAGGLLGAYFGALKFNQTILKYVLGCVLLIASFKLLFTAA